MQLSSNTNAIKNLYMKRLTGDEVKKIKQQIVDNANRYTFKDFSKNSFNTKKLLPGEQILKNTEDFQKFLYSNGIDGNSVKRVSQLNFTAPSYLDVKV